MAYDWLWSTPTFIGIDKTQTKPTEQEIVGKRLQN